MPNNVTTGERAAAPGRAIALAALIAAGVLALPGCEGPAGPPGEGTASLTDPSIMPRVVYTYPPAGEEGPFPGIYQMDCSDYGGSCVERPVFQVRFNKIMDIESVRRAIGLTSSLGGISIGPGNIASVGGTAFVIQLTNSDGTVRRGFLPVGARFTLTVDTSARDVNGNRLAAPFAISFVPEPELRVVRTVPRDGEVLGSQYLSLEITLNSKVDSAFIGSVRIEPPVTDPRWHVWWNSNRISLTGWLAGATAYTATIETTAADAAGNRLPSPYAWSFSSSPLAVNYIIPNDGAANVDLLSEILIGFSHPVDTATLRGALSFTPPFAYRLYLPEDWTVRITHRDELVPNTLYVVSIDTTLRTVSGAAMASAFRSTFTTGPLPPFAVESTDPSDGEGGVFARTSIRVRLTRSVDTASVPGAFTVDPALPGSFSYELGPRTITFTNDIPYPMGGAVRVTVDSTLRSATGVLLGERHVFSFVIRRLEVYFIDPPDGREDVPPSHPVRLHFTGALDTTTIAGALTIDPPAALAVSSAGEEIWLVPVNGWVPETDYTVRIDTTLRAEGGGNLQEPFVSTFRTAPFTIVQHSPSDGFDGHPVDFPVWLYCNDAIDTASARISFTMTDSAGAPVPGRLLFSSGYPKECAFLPFEHLAPGARYFVAVTTDFRSVHAYAIKAPVTFSFRTQ